MLYRGDEFACGELYARAPVHEAKLSRTPLLFAFGGGSRSRRDTSLNAASHPPYSS